MDVVTQNQQSVQCEVLADIGETVQCEVLKDSGQTVHCEVLTDSGQTVVNSCGHIETEPTDGTVCATDRQWTDRRRQQWTNCRRQQWK